METKYRYVQLVCRCSKLEIVKLKSDKIFNDNAEYY